MAEESVDLPMIPEKTMSRGVELRRYSSVRASSGNDEEKVVPRHLRASTGSCHDFCKYGWKHVSEAKEERLSIPKRAERKPRHHSSEEIYGGNGIMTSIPKLRASAYSEPTKIPMIRRRQSVDSLLQVSVAKSSESEKQMVKNKTPFVRVKSLHLQNSHVSSIPKKQEISSSFKVERLSIPKRAERKQRHHSSDEIYGGIMTSVSKLRASADSEPTKISKINRRQSVDSVLQISVAKSSESQKQIGNDVVLNKNKTPFVRVKSLQLQNPHVSSIHRRQKSSSSFKVETPSALASKRVEPPMKSTSERVKSEQNSTSKMTKTSSKPASKTAKTASKSKDKEMEFAEKYVTSLNPDSIATKTVSSRNSPGSSAGQNSEIKMEKKKCKVSSPLRASFPSKPLKRIASIKARMSRSLKIVSSLRNQPKPRKVKAEEHNDEAQEKTLYVIKMGSEKQTLQSDQNASQDIELSLPHSLSSPKFSSQEDQEESESATSEYVEILEVEDNGKPQKDEIVSFEDKDCQKFEGKLVETVFENSLRKLKFRRGIVLVGNATDVNADADKIDGVTEKVVLRHQDLQHKKDGLVLFNNVIEETASRLVVTRKSKVKALVGAFETVISLQEKKPVANSVN